MYSPDFQGVRRSGKAVAQLSREQWLADRERMFKTAMSVEVDWSQAQEGAGSTTLTFVQYWSAGRFADAGSKRMVVRRGPDGGVLIEKEEMLCSLLVRRNGRPVLHAKPNDQADARIAVPEAEVLPLPEESEADCPLDHMTIWMFESRQSQTVTDGTDSYHFVAWDEKNNPKAQTNYEMNFGGGVFVLRNGKRIWKGDDGGCEADKMFVVPGGAVLPMFCAVDYHGSMVSGLHVYRLTGEKVTKVAEVPVQADDSAENDTYSYKAKVEYRDVDGNGVTDIVVTPVERRNVGRKYLSSRKVINF
jgi:hypothetical protein